MKRVAKAVVSAAMLCAIVASPARGGPIVVTFDEPQLVDNDPLLTFYDGGATYRGIAGGPDLGVSFTINARERTHTSALVGPFTPPGIMQLYSDGAREGEGIPATMNVASGFSVGLFFDYAAIDAYGSISLYSGLNGTGKLLDFILLPITSPETGPGIFVSNFVTFDGVAQSIVFDGGNKQLAFDEFILGVPEPPARSLLAIGALWCGIACWLSRAFKGQVRRVPV